MAHSLKLPFVMLFVNKICVMGKVSIHKQNKTKQGKKSLQNVEKQSCVIKRYVIIILFLHQIVFLNIPTQTMFGYDCA